LRIFVKCGKYSPVKFSIEFCIICITRGKITIFESKVVIFTARSNTNSLYTIFSNFIKLCFPHFTSFSNQSLQYYSFQDALSSCCVGYPFFLLDQNLFYSWNHPFLKYAINIAAVTHALILVTKSFNIGVWRRIKVHCIVVQGTNSWK
jgi:hypothetical protein